MCMCVSGCGGGEKEGDREKEKTLHESFSEPPHRAQMGLIWNGKPWFSSTFLMQSLTLLLAHVNQHINTCTHKRCSHTIIIFHLFHSFANALHPSLVSWFLGLNTRNTNSRCCDRLKVIQWKWTETTSGVRESLIVLHCIVLSNIIQDTHLGMSLLHVQRAELPSSSHCTLLHLSLYLSLAHLSHSPYSFCISYLFIFFIFLLSSHFPHFAVIHTYILMLFLSHLVSSNLHGITGFSLQSPPLPFTIFSSQIPSFLCHLLTDFQLVQTCVHRIKHATAASSLFIFYAKTLPDSISLHTLLPTTKKQLIETEQNKIEHNIHMRTETHTGTHL